MANLRRALVDTGIADAKTLTNTSQLISGLTIFNLANSDFKVDLAHNLTVLQESDFDSCLGRSKAFDVDGFAVAVLCLEHLLLEDNK